MSRRSVPILFILISLLLSACAAPTSPDRQVLGPSPTSQAAPLPAPVTQTPLAPTITQTPPLPSITPLPSSTLTLTPTPAPSFPLPAQPLGVSIAYDKAINTGVITPEGGSLSVKGANGATYTLTFPRGALANAAFLQLYAMSTFEGLPFNFTYLGGASLQPYDIRLYKPAILTIDSQAAQSKDGWTAFSLGFSPTAGKLEFRLAPSLPGASKPGWRQTVNSTNWQRCRQI